MPATARDVDGLELFGFVSFRPRPTRSGEPSDFAATVDFTDETAERNPDWKLDLCDEVDRQLARRGGAASRR